MDVYLRRHLARRARLDRYLGIALAAISFLLLALGMAFAQQSPRQADPATDLRENFLALSIAYNHGMKALDLYMVQASQDAQALAKDEADLKWLRENPWVSAVDKPTSNPK